MLFYASLFLFCVVVSAISLWMFRSLNAVGKAVYRAILPSSKNYQHLHGNEHESAPTTNSTRVPWGWSGSGGDRRIQYEVQSERPEYTGPPPWGWPGNPHYQPQPWVQLRRPSVYQSRLGKRAHNVLYRRPERQLGHSKVAEQPQGWPNREALFEFAGRRYRVDLGAKVGRRNAGGMAAPWGWSGSRRKAALRPLQQASNHASQAQADPLGTGRPGSQLHHVGWPYRAESSEWAPRQLATAHASAGTEKQSKPVLRPWGW